MYLGFVLTIPLAAVDYPTADDKGFEFGLINRAPAATPDLSMTVRSGSAHGTEAEAVNCDVYLSSGANGKATAKSYRNGKLFKREALSETKAALQAKIAAAKSNANLKFYQPGAIVPHIKYEAFSGAESRVTLEEHSERGSLFNKSKEAEELQDLCFSLCHND